jgi:hypothetical protein
MFATTRWYPVDFANKILYLDTQGRKGDCTKIAGCTGVSGYQLEQEWPRLQAEGFLVKRQREERRGGANRGQGRPRDPVLAKTEKIKISETVHKQLKRRTDRLKQIRGKSFSMQTLVSQMILEAELTPVIQTLEPTSIKDFKIITITATAHQHLEKLVTQLRAQRPDLGANLINVFNAIAKMKPNNR